MIKNILLLTVTIILTLFALEAVVRIFGLAPRTEEISGEGLVFSDNPNLRYTLKPGGVLASYETSIDINEDGYRGPLYPRRRNHDNRVRILCLGDSIALGLYLEDDETFPRQLEERLNREKLFGKEWEVLNFGVPGYNTINEIELLTEKGLAYRPDLVILQYCYNDHSNKSDLDTRLRGPLVKHHRLIGMLMNPVMRLLTRSKLFLFAAVRIKSLKVDLESERKWWIPKEYVYDGDFFVTGLARFKELSREHGFRPLLVIFPYFEQKDSFSHYSWNYDRVMGQCREAGVKYINLLDHLVRDYGSRKPYPDFHLDKVHPTGYGNRVAADIIFNYLKEHYHE